MPKFLLSITLTVLLQVTNEAKARPGAAALSVIGGNPVDVIDIE